MTNGDRIMATALAEYGRTTAELAEATKSELWVEELAEIIGLLAPLAPSIAAHLATRLNSIRYMTEPTVERNPMGIASYTGKAGEYKKETATRTA